VWLVLKRRKTSDKKLENSIQSSIIKSKSNPDTYGLNSGIKIILSDIEKLKVMLNSRQIDYMRVVTENRNFKQIDELMQQLKEANQFHLQFDDKFYSWLFLYYMFFKYANEIPIINSYLGNYADSIIQFHNRLEKFLHENKIDLNPDNVILFQTKFTNLTHKISKKTSLLEFYFNIERIPVMQSIIELEYGVIFDIEELRYTQHNKSKRENRVNIRA
jgi:hypothetical protein